MTVFDTVAAQYDAARPAYPPEIFAALERFARPLPGADVLDVGAGTGIASRQLRGLGARVTSVEPSPTMRARLLAHTPDAAVLPGIGEDLPVPDHAFDLVTYAQAFHWVDPDRACAEAARVLRPGGALAVWWNDRPEPVPAWLVRVRELISERSQQPPWPFTGDVDELFSESPLFVRVESAEAHWTWRVGLEHYLTYIASTSPAAQLGERWPAVRARVVDVLRAEFGDGPVTEHFRCHVHVATRPG